MVSAAGMRMSASVGLLLAVGLGVGFHAYGAGRGVRAGAKELNTQVLASRFPAKPSIAPSWTIPIEDMGFAAPGANYLGQRNALVSLDFLDEDRVLFTFRIPGLMRRDARSQSEDQRAIRAVVLAVKSGAVLARTEWTVHDRRRYLWGTGDGHFLLRDQETIYEGDAALNRKPLLHFPGQVDWMGLSPGGEMVVADSLEPEKKSASGSGEAPPTGDGESDSAGQDTVLRILRRPGGQVMLVTRLRTPVEPAINSTSILGALRGQGRDWEVVLNGFGGEMRPVGGVKSACQPRLDFLSEKVAQVSGCADDGGKTLTALTTEGATLWTDVESDRAVWPQLERSSNGLRFVRETLYVSLPVSSFDPLSTNDIKGQWARVFDTATGRMVLETPLDPVLDGGGNVALSPSGRRAAVLRAGTIEIFELPDAPPLPESATAPGAR